jgi:WD40 repeat protein
MSERPTKAAPIIAGLLLLLAGATAVLGRPAAADETAPRLVLDTGGHMALVRNIVFTADGKRLISGSDDKEIRIWDVEAGTTERVIRGEIGEGEDGKILAMALSPDARTLAVGGKLPGTGGGEAAIRIIDLETGEITHLLEAHEAGILSLAFSSDGSLLASGSFDDSAILWSTSDFSLLRRVEGHHGDVNAVRFTNDSRRLVTASDDTALGLWDIADGRLVAQLSGHTDAVISIAISPLDGTIASGSLDHTIRLWSAETGTAITTLPKRKSTPTSLAFSPDGRRLLATADEAPYEQEIYDIASRKPVTTYRGHDGLTHAAAFSPDGAIAATAGGSDNQIHLWAAETAKLEQVLAGAGRSVWSAGISEDGRRIAWGHRDATRTVNAHGPLEFSLRLPGAERAPTDPAAITDGGGGFIGAATVSQDLALQRKAGGEWGYFAYLELGRGGEALTRIERNEADGYGHDSFTFLGSDRIASGAAHGWLSIYGYDGARQGDLIGHTSNVWALAATPDGSRLVSGSDDQTIRYWNAGSFESIFTLFRGRDGEWVMWTPEGYYAASPNGDRYVGWQISGGPDRSARLVTAAQLKRHFYRPDILQRAVVLGSAARAVAEAENTRFSLKELHERRPPDVRLAGLAPGTQAATSPVEVVLRFETNADPVEDYAVLVNGRRVEQAAQRLAGDRAHEIFLSVPLSTGRNRIEVVARNAVGEGRASLELSYSGPEDLERRDTLHILAIGVDDYPAIGQNLTLAGADAKAIAARIALTAGPMHARVVTTVLAKGEPLLPTAANIEKAMAELRSAGPRDTIVVFLAGHGVNDGADYLFLPTDAALEGKRWRTQTVLRWQSLQETLQSTRGRRIMLVDTCHAGNAFNARLVKDAADASIVVMTATDADTLAEERSALGHGVFTYAMLQGLGGGADLIADGRVHTRELAAFVGSEVARLTDDKQRPEAYVSSLADFVLAKPQ